MIFNRSLLLPLSGISILLLIIIFRKTGRVRKFFAFIGGFLSVLLGKYAYLSFRMLKPLTIPTLGVNSFEEFQNATPEYINRVKLDELEDSLKTGDLVLVVGTNREQKNVVAKWSGGTPFSHIGMVVRYGDDLKIFEATAHYHTVFTPLRNRLEFYDTDIIAIRQLNKPLTQEMIDTLFEFVYEVIGKQHDYQSGSGVVEMFKAAVDIRIPFTNIDLISNEENLENLFCSETVTEAYMRMGLIARGNGNPPSNEYLPGEYTNFHSWSSVELKNVNSLNFDYKLGNEIFLHPVEPDEHDGDAELKISKT